MTNEKLIKEFYSNENKIYQKSEDRIRNYRRILGDSLLFSEGEKWKDKRRLMTKIMNFNYLKNKQTKIIKIINRKFKENCFGNKN